jgi:hypothetical protein
LHQGRVVAERHVAAVRAATMQSAPQRQRRCFQPASNPPRAGATAGRKRDHERDAGRAAEITSDVVGPAAHAGAVARH